MNHCERCQATMPAHRISMLCEECYAAEWDCDFDGDINDDDGGEIIGSCDECECDLYADEDDGSGLCDQCAWWRRSAG